MSTRGGDAETQRNEAFSRLFDANWAAVRHHVEGVVADDGEVTEIVSEVFLLAWSRLRPAAPMSRTWLLRAADRTLRARARRPVVRGGALEAVHSGMTGEDAATDPAMRADVLTALGVLSRGERRIIMLTYWDGLDVGDIAEVLRSPRSRVRRTLRRARSRMIAELGLEEGGVVDG
ncbi:RNA polymerase sigma factor [Microbacterium sp. H83]|uniref:RNA polymerase sigma factor n=1 Tax=Microbacterium sp. H83 TaxID=1827324 RepID=UPI0007F4853C|nr:sigma-70 family RNA polymerase sigma factor [Microbacterium sp. H83]OAN38336.1 hypothetical protein A4X16_02815 [Microbacterium sp. H83]